MEPPSYDDLLGSLSIIIWSLTIIVTIKYVVVVLNADNEGQGGTFAMYSLLTRYVRQPKILLVVELRLMRDTEQNQHGDGPQQRKSDKD